MISTTSTTNADGITVTRSEMEDGEVIIRIGWETCERYIEIRRYTAHGSARCKVNASSYAETVNDAMIAAAAWNAMMAAAAWSVAAKEIAKLKGK